MQTYIQGCTVQHSCMRTHTHRKEQTCMRLAWRFACTPQKGRTHTHYPHVVMVVMVYGVCCVCEYTLHYNMCFACMTVLWVWDGGTTEWLSCSVRSKLATQKILTNRPCTWTTLSLTVHAYQKFVFQPLAAFTARVPCRHDDMLVCLVVMMT